MHYLSIALIAIGSIILIITGIAMLICAFRTSVLWGLLYLFVPFAAVVYVFAYWSETKKLFAAHIVGVLFLIGGVLPLMGEFKTGFAKAMKEAEAMEKAPVNEKAKDTLTPEALSAMKAEQLKNDQAELRKKYDALMAERATLRADNPAGIEEYKKHDAEYRELETKVKQAALEAASTPAAPLEAAPATAPPQ